jgi:hypothetical protein
VSEVFALHPEGQLFYTFDFSGEIPSSSPIPTISSVTYIIVPSYSPQRLYAFDTSEDLDNYTASINLAGAVHGETYQVTALATLTNGEIVPKGITVRGQA